MTEEQTDTQTEQTVQDEPKTGEAPEVIEASEAPESPEASAEPSPVAPTPPADKHYFWGIGRRKKAVARVRIRPGTGKFLVNKREVDEFFFSDRDRQAVRSPLKAVNMLGAWDIWANVGGGGFTGQAGAVLLGLARAIAKAMPNVEHELRSHGLLTRDARMSERKKPGQPGARKRFQFSKR